MTKYRIMSCTTIPNVLHSWVLERIIGKTVTVETTKGDRGCCFEMWDLTFKHEADEVEFKRRFGGAIFTPSEVEQSNERKMQRRGTSKLWKQKYETYQTMREQNNEISFR